MKQGSKAILLGLLKSILIHQDSLFQVFAAGVSCLQVFVQSNWLGGPELTNQFHFSLSEAALKEVVLDGEALVPMIKNLSLLLVARAVFFHLRHHYSTWKVCNSILKFTYLFK